MAISTTRRLTLTCSGKAWYRIVAVILVHCCRVLKWLVYCSMEICWLTLLS
jgi:hypothetical protein